MFADTNVGSPPSSQSVSKRSRGDAMANSAASSVARAEMEVKIVFHRMPALSDGQNKEFENLASRISWALRGREIRQVDLVFERENQGPIPFSTMSLGQCLCAVCAAWRLPMVNAGVKWRVNIQGRPEVEENLDKKRSRSKEHRGRRRHDDNDEQSRHQGRRHSRQEGSRSRHSGGVTRCESPHHGVTLTRPDSEDCSVDCDKRKECGPTLPWTQCSRAGDHFDVNIADFKLMDHHDRVLRDLTKSVVSYGSETVCLAKVFPLVVRKLCEGSCDHGAYMVYPVSPNFCVRCFNPFDGTVVPSHCPHCGVPSTRPSFQSVPAVGALSWRWTFSRDTCLVRKVFWLKRVDSRWKGRLPRFSDLLWEFDVDGFKGLSPLWRIRLLFFSTVLLLGFLGAPCFWFPL